MFFDLFGTEVKPKDKIYLDESERDLIEQYTEEYEMAQKNMDYIGMNAAAKKAADLRIANYPDNDEYIDTYDYSHGGLYEIYSNGSDDYYAVGYFEEVYVLNSSQMEAVGKDSQNQYDMNNPNIKSPVNNVLSSIISLLKPSNYKTPLGGYYSIIKIGGEYVYNDLKYDEMQAVIETTNYINHLTGGQYSNEYTYYMYILYGNYSPEIKVSAVYGENNTELFSMSIDLKQNESAEIFSSFANEYGTMVALNRRTQNYSYTHNT